MVLRELSESEWQHSFVPVLALSGSSNKLGGSGDLALENAVGDVKHIMDKTIGRRCCRISGAVSAANYLEVPRGARNSPLNLTGRFVYIQVRPIGDKVMTFHLDVLDATGQPERVTFSTLYSGGAGGGGGGSGGGPCKRTSTGGNSRGGRASSLDGNSKHGNGAVAASSATTLEVWKCGGGGGARWAATGRGEATADAAAGTALVNRGGALRYPVSFDTSRSRGWTVVAIDMVALLREGGGRGGVREGGGGGGDSKEYGVLRAVKLGSNMVVRGVYASDCVYSPHTLPKEMSFRTPGGGLDWETAYSWLWIPEVPDENAAPGTRRTTRPAWPPGADSPTPSVAAEARERRRMEKRHFFAEPGTLGKLLAQQDSDDNGEAPPAAQRAGTTAAPYTPGRGRSAAVGIRGRSSAKARRDSTGVSVGGIFPRTPRTRGTGGVAAPSPSSSGRRGRSTPPAPRLASPRAPYPGGGGGALRSSRFPAPSPARMRPTSAAARAGHAAPSPRSRPWGSGWRTRDRSRVPPSPTTPVMAGYGKPPLSPRRQEAPDVGGRGRAFFSGDDDDGGVKVGDVGGGGVGSGVGSGGADVVVDKGADKGGDWNWTREELEAWPGREPAPAVAVLTNAGEGRVDGEEAEEGGGEEEQEFIRGRRAAAASGGGGGMDPPVVSHVLPPGLEASRPDPPELDPDPALRLERALCYTGGDVPGATTVAFAGSYGEFMAFPSNNVVVLMETPVMPEPVLSELGGGVSQGIGADEGERRRGHEEEGEEDGSLPPQQPPTPPQVFLRGHTDTVTRLQLSHAGHLLASAQGDPLGAAGGHGIVRLWDATSLGRRSAADGGGGGGGRLGAGRSTSSEGGKCAAHFIAHRWGVSSMCFSSDDRLLCTVGGDDHRRTQVIVWDVALLCTARAGTVHGAGTGLAVVARQISDFPITKMIFSPFEKLRLVSCGRENVRFWRVRRRHLPACPAVLNDFARDLACTDLAFQGSCRGIAGVEDHTNWAEGPCVVYVSSRAGTVLQVSYHSRNLLCVLQLHDGPILSLEVNEDYAVTGSEDKVLRLWPLDFSDFLMEAAHESSVVSVCSSKDGLKLAVGTSAGSIGVLDVMTHGYTTALRSHRGAVTAAAIDPLEDRDEFATVSEDCTIRVWDLASGAQRYQFYSPTDRPTCVAYAPTTTPTMLSAPGEETAVVGGGDGGGGAVPGAEGGDGGGGGEKEEDEEERHLVAGYASGAMRVLDVPSASTLFEVQQHRSAIQQVVFTPDGTRVISAGEDGVLCLYDVSQGYHPTRVMACDEPQPGRPISLAVSPGSDRLAVIGTEPSCILIYDLATMFLKGRLGKPGRREGRFVWGASGGGGGGMMQPWQNGARSPSNATESAGGVAASSGGFLHAAFSGDGADLLACTATKFFRFPLGGGDTHAWSALLPCKASPAMASCNPVTGPGLVLVSPASLTPMAGAGDPTVASAWGGEMGWGGGGGGSSTKRGAAPRTLGSGGSALAPSELFLSQVHRDERSASVVISAPQAFAAHASPITVAAFSARGDRLITCDGTGVVLLWSNLAAPGPGAWDGPLRQESATTRGSVATVAGGSGALFRAEDFEGDGLEAEHVGVVVAADTGAVRGDEANGGDFESLTLTLELPEEAEILREAEEEDAREAPAAAAGTAGLNPTATPMGPGRRAGESSGREVASMLDQTPPPMMQTARNSFLANGGRGGGKGRAGSGQLSEAIEALQTVVEHAAAALGEGESTGAADGTRRPVVEIGQRRCGAAEVARFDEDDDVDSSDGSGINEADGEIPLRRGGGAAKTRPISRGSHPGSSAGRTATMSCVTWHPPTARLIYAEGDSLFAEDLETCRRLALLSSHDGGSEEFRRRSCVAVSADGELVARGGSSSVERPGSGGASGSLSVWRLGRDVMRKPCNMSLGGGDGGDSGDVERSKPASHAAAATVDASEEIDVVGGGEVVALAFSPSGSDLCSLGEWDGTKCLLEVRPTSALVVADSPHTGASPLPPTAAAAASIVTPLYAKTSAICMLPQAAPRRSEAAEGAGEPEPFLLVTGGDEGVGLWCPVYEQAPAGTTFHGRSAAGGREKVGLRLLGTSAGCGRATALASVGRFVVAAEVSAPPLSGGGAAAAPSVSAIDVNWLAAGGHEAGVDSVVGDEEFTWRVFGGNGGNVDGGRDVSITCLASAGPRRVAVGGSGGKLEIWDVEAVCAGGGGGGGGEGHGADMPEAAAGLVHRLDLGNALAGGSVTDMTWDAGGADAVIGAAGAGGGIWHLHLPSSSSSESRPRAAGESIDGEPRMARLWPGGNVKALS